MLRGKKIDLRPVARADIKYFLKWYNDPELIRYLSMYLPMNEICEEKWIEAIANSKNSVFFVIEAVDNRRQKKPIGSCSITNIDWKDRCGEFGIAIGETNYWNDGYGTEAGRLLRDYGFLQLNLHCISSAVYEFNGRSRAMHEKLGFREEGCRLKIIYKDGQYWDKILFGLLREEWEVKKKEEEQKTNLKS